ncbi:MAG: nidogen-like domain-containing protein [Pseudooceanicola nanhaiensis]|uniref:nidogen-like domain-containing protein n=1 Tax=Pseudooceanicola nanhaiensis TaxID=375761 RepID=UPI004057F670
MAVGGNGTLRGGLGGPVGYGELMVPRSDDGSLRLDLSAVFPEGLNYFGVLHDASRVFANTNGTLSFLSALEAYPTGANHGIARDVIAPYWGDTDTRLDGEGAESGAVWADIDHGAGIVTVTWDDVGVYRREAGVTNRVQLELHDRGGGDFDIAFRYEAIGWTIGTAPDDSGARAGLASTRLGEPHWIFAQDNAAGLADLAGTAGNTGVRGLWVHEMRDGAIAGMESHDGAVRRGGTGADLLEGTGRNDRLTGLGGDDTLRGSAGEDTLDGGPGDDLLEGGGGRDTLYGGDGRDVLNGGAGHDRLIAGDTEADLRDLVYGGDGHDEIDGGFGNDELRGDGGNDTITGGAGVDTIIGGNGDDVLTGQTWSDVILGGDGMDFINGGFGHDRVNGGADADRFYHLGVEGHGSDWVQDFSDTGGEVLVFGGTGSISDFQVNVAETANAGQVGIAEAFVIYKPTQQILWALVDGAAQEEITILLGGTEYDLL